MSNDFPGFAWPSQFNCRRSVVRIGGKDLIWREIIVLVRVCADNIPTYYDYHAITINFTTILSSAPSGISLLACPISWRQRRTSVGYDNGSQWRWPLRRSRRCRRNPSATKQKVNKYHVWWTFEVDDDARARNPATPRTIETNKGREWYIEEKHGNFVQNS